MSKEVHGKLEAVHQCEAHLDVIEHLGLVRRLCISHPTLMPCTAGYAERPIHLYVSRDIIINLHLMDAELGLCNADDKVGHKKQRHTHLSARMIKTIAHALPHTLCHAPVQPHLLIVLGIGLCDRQVARMARLMVPAVRLAGAALTSPTACLAPGRGLGDWCCEDSCDCSPSTGSAHFHHLRARPCLTLWPRDSSASPFSCRRCGDESSAAKCAKLRADVPLPPVFGPKCRPDEAVPL